MILQSGIDMEVRSVFFIIRMRQLNTCFSIIVSLDLYGQSSKWLQPYFHHAVLPIYLGIGYMKLTIGLKSILGGRLPLFGRYVTRV
jgi:hypothetical protein